jgi:hypothetical protein
VAAALTAEEKSGALQSGSHVVPGQVGGEFGHVPRPNLCGFNLNEFLARLGGNRIPVGAAILQIDLDGLADIAEGLSSGIPLADAAGQRWNAGDISAIWLLFQNDRVSHR